MKRLKRLSTSSAPLLALSVLALGVLAATTLSALADHNVYPPGWNKPDPNVPHPSTISGPDGAGTITSAIGRTKRRAAPPRSRG